MTKRILVWGSLFNLFFYLKFVTTERLLNFSEECHVKHLYFQISCKCFHPEDSGLPLWGQGNWGGGTFSIFVCFDPRNIERASVWGYKLEQDNWERFPYFRDIFAPPPLQPYTCHTDEYWCNPGVEQPLACLLEKVQPWTLLERVSQVGNLSLRLRHGNNVL